PPRHAISRSSCSPPPSTPSGSPASERTSNERPPQRPDRRAGSTDRGARDRAQASDRPRRFRQLAAEATREQQTPVGYLAALLEAEYQERAERREKRRLIDARFPLIKRLEDFRFAENPKIPQATIAALADGSWIDDRESVVFV